MPNWCTTDYIIRGAEDNVTRLLSDLKRVVNMDRSQHKDYSTFLPDSNWLGYVLQELLPEHKDEDVTYRGTFTYIGELQPGGDDTCSIRLSTESAWRPCTELFALLGDSYCVDVFYYAEELGCQLLETNDSDGTFFPERYIMYSDDDRSEYNDFKSLKKEFEEYTGVSVDTFEQMEAVIYEYDLGDSLCVYMVDVA